MIKLKKLKGILTGIICGVYAIIFIGLAYTKCSWWLYVIYSCLLVGFIIYVWWYLDNQPKKQIRR